MWYSTKSYLALTLLRLGGHAQILPIRKNQGRIRESKLSDPKTR